MKHNNAGFTLAELMTVIAIIAILSAIAVPNMIGWRERAKLGGAAENLRGDLQWAKIRAIHEHAPVSVLFFSNGYEIFVDNGDPSGGAIAADYIRDGNEPLVRSRQLPAGVAIDLAAPNIDQTQFDTRGRCAGVGTLVLGDSAGEQKKITISPLGQIRQE